MEIYHIWLLLKLFVSVLYGDLCVFQIIEIDLLTTFTIVNIFSHSSISNYEFWTYWRRIYVYFPITCNASFLNLFYYFLYIRHSFFNRNSYAIPAFSTKPLKFAILIYITCKQKSRTFSCLSLIELHKYFYPQVKVIL